MAVITLEQLYDSEVEAVKMYTAALENCADDERKVFEHILKEEKEHAAMLEDLRHDERSLRQHMKILAGRL